MALVVGNGAYQNADALKNPVNDARAMAKVLTEAGFEVILRENVTRRAMTDALAEYASKLTPGGVGLFYYAGHGMQVRGANFLLPVDATLTKELDLKFETLDIADVLNLMDDARVRLSLLILDACRDNPFARRFRSTSRGLAQVDAPRGTVIAYATAPGDTAADGDGDNGLYTAQLLKAMATPGLRLEDVLKQTIDGVARASGNRQTPWVNASFRGEFYFFPAATSQPATAPPAPTPATDPAETALWNAVAGSNNPAMYEAFLQRFPSGLYAGIARARLAELRATVSPPPPAPAAVASTSKPPADIVSEPQGDPQDLEKRLNLNDAQRARVQAGLAILKLDPGTPDGVFGQRTRAMIREYQSRRSEQQTGYLTAVQYSALLRETEDTYQADRKRAADIEREASNMARRFTGTQTVAVGTCGTCNCKWLDTPTAFSISVQGRTVNWGERSAQANPDGSFSIAIRNPYPQNYGQLTGNFIQKTFTYIIVVNNKISCQYDGRYHPS